MLISLVKHTFQNTQVNCHYWSIGFLTASGCTRSRTEPQGLSKTSRHYIMTLPQQTHRLCYSSTSASRSRLFLRRKNIGSHSAIASRIRFKRSLLSIDVSVCLSATLTLNVSETKRLVGSCLIGTL